MSRKTKTPTATATRTPTPTLTPVFAIRLLEPSDGAQFIGWNAEIVLRWSSTGLLSHDDYHVIRIPYDDAGGIAEFWRKETQFQVPPHFSLKEVGFPDRHYNWSVQVMRCVEKCDAVAHRTVATLLAFNYRV